MPFGLLPLPSKHIMRRANLSYGSLREIVALLERGGLVAPAATGGRVARQAWSLTPRGRAALEAVEGALGQAGLARATSLLVAPTVR